MSKKFVKVDAVFDLDGKVIPQRIYWDEEQVFRVEKVLDVRPGISLKTKMPGMRYKVLLKGKERFLYFSDNRWFVEVGEEMERER